MDASQYRVAEMIWQHKPELLADVPRLEVLLLDYVTSASHRRAIVTAVESKMAQSVRESSLDR